MEADPFPELTIADTSILEVTDARVHCPQCGRKRMYFCYNCVIYLNGLDSVMPKVKLPIPIDIIKHKQELDSKSTAPHAVLLSESDCQILSFPDIPSYDPEKVPIRYFDKEDNSLKRGQLHRDLHSAAESCLFKDVLIFPSDDSVTVSDWADQTKSTGACPGRVVFIDGTWNQIHPILNCPQLQGLPRVALQDYTTKFWRPNGSKRDASCLATIEAIYYFLREYHSSFRDEETYDGQYDNLLMLFKFLYGKIRSFHNGGDALKAYKT